MTFLLLYADPGSGMMLLQIILAFGASALFYFRKYIYMVLGRKDAPIELEGVERFADVGKREKK